MDIISMIMSKKQGDVQTINLDKYHFPNQNETLGFLIVNVYAMGGGSYEFATEEDFWGDLNTKKPLRVQLDASFLMTGYVICSENTTVVYAGEEVHAFCFSLVIPNTKHVVEVDIMRKTPDKNPITVDVRVKGVSG